MSEMSTNRGGDGFLDLAAAPRRRWSGLLVLLAAVLLAAGSLCVFLFFPRGDGNGADESGGSESVTVPLPGTQGVSFRVAPAWTRAARDGVEGIERSVDGGTLFIGIHLETERDGRKCISAVLAAERDQRESSPEAEVRPYRWIRKPEDPPALGLIAFEAVIKDADSEKPRQEHHHLWVQEVCPAHHLALLTTSKSKTAGGDEDCGRCDAAATRRIIHLAYTCLEDQTGAVDAAEKVIKTLAFP